MSARRPHRRLTPGSMAPSTTERISPRQRNRFDFRQRYERLPDADGGQPSKWVTTLRADLWTGFADGCEFYGRLDQPFIYSEDVTSSFNPNGHSRFGQGDLLTEMVIVPPPPTRQFGYGLGIRAAWPTASLNEAGTENTRSDPSRPPGTPCRRSALAASSLPK